MRICWHYEVPKDPIHRFLSSLVRWKVSGSLHLNLHLTVKIKLDHVQASNLKMTWILHTLKWIMFGDQSLEYCDDISYPYWKHVPICFMSCPLTKACKMWCGRIMTFISSESFFLMALVHSVVQNMASWGDEYQHPESPWSKKYWWETYTANLIKVHIRFTYLAYL